MGKLSKNFKQRIDLLNKRDVGLDDGYYFNQNDIGTATILAEIRNGGDIVDLTGTSVSLSVLKPDKQKAYTVCPISDAKSGKVLLTFTREMLAFAGLASFQVTIQKGDKIVVSNNFYFTINDAIIQDSDIGDIENMPLLVQLQSNASNIINNEKKVITRLENLEVHTLNKEEERNRNEETRVENEKKRKINDEERKKIDKQIKSSLSEINGNLDSIKELKNTIVDQEGIRESNEVTRIQNENERKRLINEISQNEEVRKSNEQNRANSFLEYSNREEERKRNEKQRVTEEEKRQSKENERIELEKKIEKHFKDSSSLISEAKSNLEDYKNKFDKVQRNISATKDSVASSELERTNAEKVRVENEKKRISEENIRIENEKKRESMYLKAKDSIEKIEAVASETKLHEYVDTKIDLKADKNHTHTKADIIDLDNSIDEKVNSKADREHRHNITDIDSLEEKLNEKLNASDFKTEIKGYQPKGDYVVTQTFDSKNTELKDYTNITVAKIKNELSNELKTKIEEINNKIRAYSGKEHTHKTADIIGLDDVLNNKLNSSEITKYLTIDNFDKKIKEKFDNINENTHIKSLSSSLNDKASNQSIIDMESEIKGYIQGELPKYQLKGNYLNLDDVDEKGVNNTLSNVVIGITRDGETNIADLLYMLDDMAKTVDDTIEYIFTKYADIKDLKFQLDKYQLKGDYVTNKMFIEKINTKVDRTELEKYEPKDSLSVTQKINDAISEAKNDILESVKSVISSVINSKLSDINEKISTVGEISDKVSKISDKVDSYDKSISENKDKIKELDVKMRSCMTYDVTFNGFKIKPVGSYSNSSDSKYPNALFTDNGDIIYRIKSSDSQITNRG